MLALTFVDFLDELTSGVPVLGAPDIRAELAFAYVGAAWVLLVLPLALGAVAEAPLLLLSDRWPRRRTVAIALLAQAVCTLGAAAASSAWMLGLALALWGTAGGITNGVAQGALMDAFPRERERVMTRWALMGTLGDAATPSLMALVLSLGGSWRTALVVVSVLFAAHAVVVAVVPLRSDASDDARRASPEDEPEPKPEPLRTSLAAGLGNTTLLLWLAGTALCCLLDEILVAFGSLFLRERLGATPAEQAVAFTAFAAGGVVGLLLTDRLLARMAPRRLLACAAALCVAAYVAWIAAGSVLASVPLLALVGLSVAPLYPIAAAQAYGALPGRPGVVAALDKLFAPIELAAPLVVGWAADRFGLETALALLLVQPLGLLVIALVARSRPARSDSMP